MAEAINAFDSRVWAKGKKGVDDKKDIVLDLNAKVKIRLENVTFAEGTGPEGYSRSEDTRLNSSHLKLSRMPSSA